VKSALALALALSGLSTFALPAAADEVTWDLSGITLNNGVAVTGSFVYDADTNTYSSINLATADGYTYTVDYTSNASALFADTGAANLTNTPLLAMIFDDPLTDAGGTIDIDIAEEEKCDNADCSTATSGPYTYSGEIVAQASSVPEPATIPLVLTGLLVSGVAIARKRRMVSATKAAA